MQLLTNDRIAVRRCLSALAVGGMVSLASADLIVSNGVTGPAGTTTEATVTGEGSLRNFSITMDFDNLGNFVFASDLLVGIVAPNGAAIEFGGGGLSLDGYDGITFADAGNFPNVPWRTENNGTYNHGPVDLNSYGLGGVGTYRVILSNGWAPSPPASWNGQVTLGGLNVPTDSDSDGVFDALDNCPATPNPAQADADNDGIGDACDVCPGGDDAVDSDGDSVPDGCDTCPGEVNVYNATQATYHASIQDAFDAAVEGDVIELGACVFHESGIVLSGQNVELRGRGRELTIIDGQHAGTIMELVNASPTLQDLTLRNGRRTGTVGGAALHVTNPTGGTDGPLLDGVDLRNNEVVGVDGSVIYLTNSAAIVGMLKCRALDNTVGPEAMANVIGGEGLLLIFDSLLARNVGGVVTVQPRANSEIHTSTFVDNDTEIPVVGISTLITGSIFEKPVQSGPFGAGPNFCLLPGGTGTNIDGAATFVDAANGDYRLAPGSLGIDAADYSNYSDYIDLFRDLTDLGGNPRTHDDLGTANTGVGSIRYMDIGAYEFQGTTVNCPGDADGDGDVDLSDLALVLSQFGQIGAGLNGDADDDGDVDLSDLAIVLGAFGESC